MKTIDWNQASELGLIKRINHEILHPLGLAMSRSPIDGVSKHLVVAEDWVWEYSDETLRTPILSNSEIKERIAKFIENK